MRDIVVLANESRQESGNKPQTKHGRNNLAFAVQVDEHRYPILVHIHDNTRWRCNFSKVNVVLGGQKLADILAPQFQNQSKKKKKKKKKT